MDRELSPDYFSVVETPDLALYPTGDSGQLQLPLPSPSPNGPLLNGLIMQSGTEGQGQSNSDELEYFGPAISSPITFVDGTSEPAPARRGRPPNPEGLKQPLTTQKRSVGRPLDPTRHRPYSGTRTSTTGTIHQRILKEFGLGHPAIVSTAGHVAAPSDPIVALPTGPRIEYVIPDADPNQVIDLDYTSMPTHLSSWAKVKGVMILMIMKRMMIRVLTSVTVNRALTSNLGASNFVSVFLCRNVTANCASLCKLSPEK
ncbi:hypothetical protein B0H13DRAFT_1916057 [Mycena leptocephala]|nr:hypothetical protein B0H13DRAFT_1916057 [Mycena leptocephala]